MIQILYYMFFCIATSALARPAWMHGEQRFSATSPDAWRAAL